MSKIFLLSSLLFFSFNVNARLIGMSHDDGAYYSINSSTGEAKLIHSFYPELGFGLSFLNNELFALGLLEYEAGWVNKLTLIQGNSFTSISMDESPFAGGGLASNETEQVFYSILYSNVNYSWLKILSNDGSVVTVGSNIGIRGEGMAYDDTHGILYATDELTKSLYTVDIAAGTATLVGSLNLPYMGHNAAALVGLAYDEVNDILYANIVDNPQENRLSSLYRIDTSTGAATLIGPNYAHDIHGLAWIEGPDDPTRYDEGFAAGYAEGILQCNPTEVTICHRPGTKQQKTILVSPDEVAKHLKHGDYEGSCV